jgi:Zn-dependent peptidase ImmA (M78 family)
VTLFVHKESGDFDIVLPNMEFGEGNKLNIAFELGHYFLHGKAKTYSNRAEGGRAHDEASVFMNSFLVTNKELECLFKKYDGSVSDIFFHTGLPANYLYNRCYSLNLLDKKVN